MRKEKHMANAQGKKANENGRKLEHTVEELINNKNIPSVYFKDIDSKFGAEIIEGGYKGFLLKNVPFINAFGGKSRGEFVLKLNNKPAIRIECRGQNVSGSVDEKIVYLMQNCMKFDEEDVIVVLDGNGIRSEAREWAIRVAKMARVSGKKNVKVLSLFEFKTWFNKMIKSSD